jgi:subtilisin family serine protease
MVQRRLMLLVLVAVILIGGVSTASADLREIVMFVEGTPLVVQQQVVALSGSTVLQNLSLITALAVLTNDQGLAFLESKVQGVCNPLLDPLCVVAGVYDDLLTSIDPICPTTAPPSPESYRWGQQKINEKDAHTKLPSCKGQGSAVEVAVLDTGIDWTHLNTSLGELYQKDAGGFNALPGGGSYFDDHGHGTHMAGIIAAALNGLGVIGGAPLAKLVSVKVLDSTGHGHVSDVINGMKWVYDSDIRLVNMSFGFPFSNQSDGTPLMQAIQRLYNDGVIMVAAAGNRCAAAPITEDDGGDSCGPVKSCSSPLSAVTYPAAYQGLVLAVGATDIDDNIPAYSLSGPELDVVAPGGAPKSGAPDNGKILSTNTGGGYGKGYGTSQAAAQVAGAVGLVLRLHPEFSFVQVSNLLKTTAVDLKFPSNKQGAGRIDVKQMIDQICQ